VSEPEFARALHDADFYAITEKEGSGASFFPSKTIPAIASGTPILAVSSPDSPLGREMSSQGIGAWFPWNRCSEIGGLLSRLGSSPQDFLTWRQNALRRSQFFDRERCMNTFQQILDDVVHEYACLRTPVRADRRVSPTLSQ
jgi:hypothetical protein